MFLHLHYFSDVLAGFAAGLAWLAVCIAMTEVGLRRARLPSRTRHGGPA
jgi:membrane-associated phospholipid phosphatase